MLGLTDGYSRDRAATYRYSYHGIRKMTFVYELSRLAQQCLSNPMFESKKGPEIFMIDVRKLPIEGKNSLVDVLKTVNDRRVRRGRLSWSPKTGQPLTLVSHPSQP